MRRDAVTDAMPQSLEAEQMVLGALMIDAGAWDRIGALCADDFSNASHAKIFAAARAAWVAGDACEAVIVSVRLRDRGELESVGGLEYLAGLTNAVPSMGNVARYAEIVIERAMLRGVIATSAAMRDKAMTPGANVQTLVETALADIGALADGRHEGGMVDFGAVVEMSATRAITGDRVLYSNMLGVPALERSFGRLEPGQFIVVAGRPGMGKTVLGLQCALMAARAQHRVAMFELEMTDFSLGNRALSAWSNVPLQTIRFDDCRQHVDAIRAAQARLSQLQLKLNTTPGLHVDSLRAQCRAMSRRAPLNLIVVDHLTLLRGEGRDKREQVGYVSNALKIIAKENNAVVLGLVQLNREADKRANKRPELIDLRESGEIEQDADGVIMLYRDDYYNQHSEQKGVIEMIGRKNRDGTCGTAYARASFHVSRIDELERDYQPPARNEDAGSRFRSTSDKGF